MHAQDKDNGQPLDRKVTSYPALTVTDRLHCYLRWMSKLSILPACGCSHYCSGILIVNMMTPRCGTHISLTENYDEHLLNALTAHFLLSCENYFSTCNSLIL